MAEPVKQRRIKIVATGEQFAHVIDAETGEEIANVTGVTIHIEASNHFRPVAMLEIINPDFDIHADVEVETTKSYHRLDK